MAKTKTNASTSANASVAHFRRVSERHVESVFELFPAYGSAVGSREFDSELEKPDAQLYRRYEKLLRNTLAETENLPEFDFGGDDWLDRRAFLSELRCELWSIERGAHVRNPDMWASGALDCVYRLIVKNADNLAPVAGAILSRMRKLPAYLEHAASMLQSPVPLWQSLALKSCRHAPALFDAIARPLAQTGQASPEAVDRLVKGAQAAFRTYAGAVKNLKPGDPRGFAVGTARFEALIRERLGWEMSAAEAEGLGRMLAARVSAELKTEAKRFSASKSPREILDEAAARWSPASGLLNEYTRQTARMRQAFADAELVTFPKKESLLVKPVPEFLRHHFATAAYSQPGCYDADQTGIFWVNDLSQIRTTPQDKAKEIRQHFGVPATCAHEAYPGHHLQFCTANRHPSKLRRLFAHAVFYEGWTLWCEQMCVDFGIVTEPAARLNQLHDALWRAHRILIDCGLQTGSMSCEQAVRHLMRHVGFTRARAESDVNWYTMSPTVPMSYLLGRTELLRVKQKKMSTQGWSVRQFNDWALSFGTLPWRWIEQSGL